MMKSELGNNHIRVAVAYDNIGGIYYYMGNYEKSLKYRKKALRIFKARWGGMHPDVATCYNNMAGVYEDMKEYDKALKYSKKALKIWERWFGKEHIYVAESCYRMGFIYYKKNEWGKAYTYFDRALPIFLSYEETAVSRRTYTIYSFMAIFYDLIGDEVKAKEYIDKSNKIEEMLDKSAE